MRVVLNINTEINTEKDWEKFKDTLNLQIAKAAFSIQLLPASFVAHANLDFFQTAWGLLAINGASFDERAKCLRDCVSLGLEEFIRMKKFQDSVKNTK